MILRHLAALAFCLSLPLTFSGCGGSYATIGRKPIEFHPVASASQELAGALRSLEEGKLAARQSNEAALGHYLEAARQAQALLARRPADEAARDAYNHAVAQVFAHLGRGETAPWNGTLHVPAGSGSFELSCRPDPRPQWNPAMYDFTPAAEFDIDGKYVREHVIKPGIGAPLVATGRGMNQRAEADFALPKIFYGVTALLHFEGRRAIIAFEDPLQTETVRFAGSSQPLAADFTTPLAVMLAATEPEKLELSRLLNPEKYARTARICRLQPYDPDKTVVLVIHGLMDSPATWAPMLNHLRGDARIRQKYQFWFYSYPSGYPYPHSAAILRQQLDLVGQRYPMKKPMVVIGHSMGGCISRLLITDTGDELWRGLFGKSPAETPMSAGSRKMLEDALIFRHRKEVGRVIFIAAPLRGSDMASNWMGRLGSRLVRAPGNLVKVGSDILRASTFQANDLPLKRIPNSVDTLAPNNRFVRAIQKIPLTPGIPHHVISGDRGKGGNPDHTKPVRSDGIVPYWSSHMETALSEKVVPSNHSAHQNPEAIAEVERILLLHGHR